MTVKELISSLQSIDPDYEVVVYNNGVKLIDVVDDTFALQEGCRLIDRYKLLDDDIDSLRGTNYCVVLFTERKV